MSASKQQAPPHPGVTSPAGYVGAFAAVLVGIGLAWFAWSSETPLQKLTQHRIALPSWLPSNSSLPLATFVYDRAPDRPGKQLADKGIRGKYPVVIIPGFVTSGLELWQGLECFQGLFRQRLWTSVTSATSFLSNPRCWMRHLSLNFTTGLDPNGVRVRNAQGLEAIDFFFPGYDVWANVIEGLADIGYDGTNMVALPYDWRLAIPNLELRDGYFSKLRYQVEMFHTTFDEKVMLVAHSWGDNVARAFLHWMEEQSPGWVDKHVAVHFNAAGPVLGVPKALTSLLSGELRETAQLSGVARIVGEELLGKEDRTLVWRTWGSALGMMPVGGSAVWGNQTFAPDDMISQRCHGGTGGAMLTVTAEDPGGKPMSSWEYLNMLKEATKHPLRHLGRPSGQRGIGFLNVEDAVGELINDVGPSYLHHMQHWSNAEVPHNMSAILEVNHGSAAPPVAWKPDSDVTQPAASGASSSQAAEPLRARRRTTVRSYDPLKTPLPKAPGLRIYCGYGHGVKTERKYHYVYTNLGLEEGQCRADRPGSEFAEGQVAAGDQWNINGKAHRPKCHVEHGMEFTDGDGTVPLVSLGALCYRGWRTSKLNPHKVKVVVREYEDASRVGFQDLREALRGGRHASTHVEVLGNHQFMFDLLYAAAGMHDELQDDVITSKIASVVENMDVFK